MEILEWWNLIFLLPALAAVLFVLLLAVGAMPVDDIGIDVDVDADDGGHDLLSVLGLGRVPLSIVLITFCLLWGSIGWFAVHAFSARWPEPGVFIWPSLAAALLGAGGLTRLTTGLLARVMPRTESYGAGARELVGRLAETRYAVSTTAGSVQVHDQYGTLHEVPARILPGETPIPAGARVVLWRYDEAAGAYLVTQDDAFNSLPAA
ncbi:MAG: DUF1449 family protein [Thermomicrobiales bacterium]|nr:DUF1449 family protein [Thermomicrobiales bacterium]